MVQIVILFVHFAQFCLPSCLFFCFSSLCLGPVLTSTFLFPKHKTTQVKVLVKTYLGNMFGTLQSRVLSVLYSVMNLELLTPFFDENRSTRTSERVPSLLQAVLRRFAASVSSMVALGLDIPSIPHPPPVELPLQLPVVDVANR